MQDIGVYVRGLEAAPEALAADRSVGVSLRRLARSLALAVAATGTTDLAARAHRVHDASDANLERATRDLLAHLEASAPRRQTRPGSSRRRGRPHCRRHGPRLYPRFRDIVRLLGVALIENVGYRQLSTYWRIRGMVSKLRGAHGWGAMERRGFTR